MEVWQGPDRHFVGFFTAFSWEIITHVVHCDFFGTICGKLSHIYRRYTATRPPHREGPQGARPSAAPRECCANSLPRKPSGMPAIGPAHGRSRRTEHVLGVGPLNGAQREGRCTPRANRACTASRESGMRVCAGTSLVHAVRTCTVALFPGDFMAVAPSAGCPADLPLRTHCPLAKERAYGSRRKKARRRLRAVRPPPPTGQATEI